MLHKGEKIKPPAFLFHMLFSQHHNSDSHTLPSLFMRETPWFFGLEQAEPADNFYLLTHLHFPKMLKSNPAVFDPRLSGTREGRKHGPVEYLVWAVAPELVS